MRQTAEVGKKTLLIGEIPR